MITDSKLFRFVFTSPWLLLLFLITPFLIIVNVKFHLGLPLASPRNLLFINNVCFGLFAAVRLVYYLRGLSRPIRYGAESGMPRKVGKLEQPASEVRRSMVAAGFVFNAAGWYAEKRDRGYIGTLLLYAGLVIALSIGSWDNFRQFSGVLLHGVGIAVDLNDKTKYQVLEIGPFASMPSNLPKLKIERNLIPDAVNPRGAAVVHFLGASGGARETTLSPFKPYLYGGYEIYQTKMLYEPTIAAYINGATPVFHGKIMLNILPEKMNDYNYYSSFAEGTLDGEVYYQPEKSRLKFILRQGRNILMDKELLFQVDQKQDLGNISFCVEKMGVWSEIHVQRRRHMPFVLFGAFTALIGLVVRAAIRPQRAWLEEAPEGCRLRTVGKASSLLPMIAEK